MLKKLLGSVNVQRVGALIIGVAVLSYSVYHVIRLFGEDISTIATGMSTEARVIDGKGYVFRDETLLYSSATGVANYHKDDGEKVSKTEALATVSQKGDKRTQALVKYYDEKIEILERSVGSGKTLSDLPEINDGISDTYYSVAKMLATGDTGAISTEMDKLLEKMNTKSLITNENSPVSGVLDEMRERRESLISNGGESVTEYSSESGYFYSYADGYENYFTLDAAKALTAESFYELTASSPEKIGDAVYGKLAKSNEWMFVIRLPSLNAQYFSEGEEYPVEFVENGHTVIPMMLNKIVTDDSSDAKILVFRANRLPEGFVFSRAQSVSIEMGSTTGIYVPRSAMHRAGGEDCVYVLKGSVVKMRWIEIIYEAKDYCLVATDVESGSTVPYLSQNEQLIVSGENLFDGRILD